jgi:hypothetical protein
MNTRVRFQVWDRAPDSHRVRERAGNCTIGGLLNRPTCRSETLVSTWGDPREEGGAGAMDGPAHLAAEERGQCGACPSQQPAGYLVLALSLQLEKPGHLACLPQSPSTPPFWSLVDLSAHPPPTERERLLLSRDQSDDSQAAANATVRGCSVTACSTCRPMWIQELDLTVALNMDGGPCADHTPISLRRSCRRRNACLLCIQDGDGHSLSCPCCQRRWKLGENDCGARGVAFCSKRGVGVCVCGVGPE